MHTDPGGGNFSESVLGRVCTAHKLTLQYYPMNTDCAHLTAFSDVHMMGLVIGTNVVTEPGQPPRGHWTSMIKRGKDTYYFFDSQRPHENKPLVTTVKGSQLAGLFGAWRETGTRVFRIMNIAPEDEAADNPENKKAMYSKVWSGVGAVVPVPKPPSTGSAAKSAK